MYGYFFKAIKPRLFGFLGFAAFNKFPKLLEGIVIDLFVFSVYSDTELLGDFDADNAAVAEEEFNIFHNITFYSLN